MGQQNKAEYWVLHKHNFFMLLFSSFAAGIMTGMFLGVLLILQFA